jgi:NifU-like protein
MGVSSARISRAAIEGGLQEVEEITDATGAGGGCGSCHPEIEELLAELQGRPVAEEIARNNRTTCHDATLLRIEAALYQGVQPALPSTEIELVALEGLHVDLHLYGEDTPTARALIAERLTKLICPALEVVFS